MADSSIHISEAVRIEVAKLHLQSGDTLLIKPNVKLTSKQRDAVRRYFEDCLDCEVILSFESLEVSVITKEKSGD